MKPGDEEDWDAWVTALKDRLQARPAAGRGWAPFDNRQGRLKTAVYELVLAFREKKRLGVIKQNILRDVGRPRDVSFAENQYYWIFWFLWKNDEIGLKKDEVSPFARQLKYADRNKVDPEVLIGFLYQQGSYPQLSEKLRMKKREPWYPAYAARRKAAK